MSAVVPHLRPVSETGAVKVAARVTSVTWQEMGGLANWLMGHGSQLIPQYNPGFTIDADTSSTWHFYLAPKAQAVERIWVLYLRAGTSTATCDITIGGSTVTRQPYLSRETAAPAIILQTLASKSSTVGDVSLQIAANDGDIVVEGIACYEQTRSELAQDTTDYGVDLPTLNARRPIVDLANKSIAAVCDAYDNLDARRSSLLQWSQPDDAAPFTVSASYVAALEADVPIIGATVTGGTTTSLEVWVRVKATGGQIQARVVTASTDTSATTSGTSFAWLKITDATCAADDLAQASGLPSGAWTNTTVSVQIKCNTATKAEIAAIAVIRTTKPL